MIVDEDIYDFLEHHGVQGMRWGRRKGSSSAPSAGSSRSSNKSSTGQKSKGAIRLHKVGQVIKLAGIVAIGALMAKDMVDKNKSLKMAEVRRESKNINQRADMKRALNNSRVMQTQMSAIAPGRTRDTGPGSVSDQIRRDLGRQVGR
jgi:hypothetical protein